MSGGDRPSEEAPLREELERLRAALAAAEALAEQAERLATMGRLMAGVVHELNNPLTAVTMYAASLASGAADPGDREKAAAILDAAGRIQRLARELIGYVRPGTEPARFDLAEVVGEALRLCKSELKGAGAVVEPALARAMVRGGRQSLVQAAVALICNAARATGSGHRIRVSVVATRGEATLSVSDEGAGMAPDVLARAFEPFFTTRPGEALGLGLSTAKAIVERYEGKISLESAPGRGTTAVVVLPAAEDGDARG